MHPDDLTPGYYALDFKKIRAALRSSGAWVNAILIIGWIAIAIRIFNDEIIQYFQDSFEYKALSLQPLTLKFLLYGERPPSYPLILRLLKSDTGVVIGQLGFFFAAWFTLFHVLRRTIKPTILYLILVFFCQPYRSAKGFSFGIR